MVWRKDQDKNGAPLAYRTTPLESGVHMDEFMFTHKVNGRSTQGNRGLSGLPGFQASDGRLEERQKSNCDGRRRADLMKELEEGDSVWVRTSN